MAGLERFARTCVEAFAGEIAVLKPQSAFFERKGSRGIAILEALIADARSAGALVLLDVKRGDLGSTMQGYADAYLDQSSPLAADAVTVTPYLGFESLRPMLDAAAANAAGVFVVTLTSNPEGAEVQRAMAGGRTVAGAVLAAVRAENDGATPLGSVGAVVGATLADASRRTCGSTVRCWRPASAYRVGLPRTSGGSSRTCTTRSCRPPRAACWPPGRSVQGLRDAAARCLDDLA